MTTGRSGRSQNEQIALWASFVDRTFEPTRKRVMFGGKVRKVYLAKTREFKQKTGLKAAFVVLDEWHGALEVLDEKPRHLGSVQLVIADTSVRLGLFKRGTTHRYTWISK